MKTASTWMRFEKKAKQFFKRQGYDILDLTSSGTFLPDLLVTRKDKSFFVECKHYQTCKTEAELRQKWKKSQQKQFFLLKRMDRTGVPVFLLAQIGDEVIFKRVHDL